MIGAWEYDANGNRTRTITASGTIVPTCTDGGSVNQLDQLCTYGSFTYTYDAKGMLQSKSSGSGSTQYTYDSAGLLRSVVLPSGSVIHYVYDAMGRRIGKVKNGALVKGWLYADDLRPIAQLDATGALESTFGYGTRGNIPDYIVKKNGSSNITYRVIADHLGTPRLLVNVASGAVAYRLELDEWGQVVSESGDATLHPFGFAGGLWDRETGLVRYGARDYDAYTGRWTARDPILFDGGDSNLYAYVGNDPINFIDPEGLSSWDQDLADFSAGLGDALLLGFGDDLRDALGIEGVDRCSDAYSAGGWASFAAGGARLGYAAAAKGISLAASSGAAASAGRQTLKTIARLGFGRGWRSPNLAGMSDDAIRASAGRTNPWINGYGAGVAGAGAAGGSSVCGECE